MIEFITGSDINDNILICRDSDLNFANDYLYRMAHNFGLEDTEIYLPARSIVKQLGAAIACRECAVSMVGSDATVMVDGSRSEDIYFQKYKMYMQLAQNIEKGMSYADFAVSGTDGSGKRGVGIVSLSRA